MGVVGRLLRVLTAVYILLATLVSVPMRTAATDGWGAVTDGAVILFRHAEAPGFGDPPGFRHGDCSTQRNLDGGGREQSRRIGETFRARSISVTKVLSSQWCRSRETAELAFPGLAAAEPSFNSFFDDRSRESIQTEAARGIIAGWRGPGVLVIVTHQVNITALTGISPGPGEGIVVTGERGSIRVTGRIRP